jgi:microcystin-dependent protein
MSDPLIGEIRIFGGNFAPMGWALCDGQLLPISSHQALFSVLGTQYGGDGITTFGLPGLRGRAPVHWGDGPATSNVTLGSTGGSETNTLTTSTMAAHNHAFNVSPSADSFELTDNVLAKAPAPQGSGATPTDAMSSSSIGNTGGAQSFATREPFLGITYIIALVGTYPSRS